MTDAPARRSNPADRQAHRRPEGEVHPVGREKYKERRMPVRSYDHAKRDPIKNYFPLPNEIFVLGLNAGEIAVYAYLLFCEDRVTFQCWPSCRSIGRATGMSVNTVRKYIRSLEAKGLITTSLLQSQIGMESKSETAIFSSQSSPYRGDGAVLRTAA